MNVVTAARRAAGRGFRLLAGAVTYVSWPYIRAKARGRMAINTDWQACLFVCYGNICRSPYAEAVLRGIIDDPERTTDSAGFFGPDRPPPDRAVTVALERGWDTRRHRSKLVERSLLEPHMVVIVMEPWQARALRKEAPDWEGAILNLADLDPIRRRSRAIQDPYGGDSDRFHSVFSEVERCVDAFLALTGVKRRILLDSRHS